jgi:DNA-binding transcriptional LysR family regulator
MEMGQIRAFLALAETLSFTRAAERCGIAQPSLSRAIKKLEGELGAPLVRRERNRTHLTEVGRIVRPRLEQALSLTELATAEAIGISTMAKAQLTLGVMCTIGPGRMIALVERMSCRAPQLELRLRDAPGPQIVEMLLAGEIDVALVGLPDYPDELCAHPLYDERYVIAFPPGHRFERLAAVTWDDLAGERYLERLNCEYIAHLEAAGGRFHWPLDVRYASEHEDWIQAMISAGLGCACVPEFTPLLPSIVTRPLVEPALSRRISLVTVRGRRHLPAVELFCRLCVAMK